LFNIEIDKLELINPLFMWCDKDGALDGAKIE